MNSSDFENPAVENDNLAAGNIVDTVETSVSEFTACLPFREEADIFTPTSMSEELLS